MPNIPQKYKKDSEQVYSYGTAGFRMKYLVYDSFKINNSSVQI